MKTAKIIAWLLFLAVALGAIWYYLFPSPERQIENDLKKLSSAISAKVSSSAIRKAANANHIASFFSADAIIHTEGFNRLVESLNGRDEVMQAVMAGRSADGALSAEFYNIRVELAPDRENAVAFLTAIVKISAQSEPMTASLKITFKKIDGDWLITIVDPIGH